ncbi:MAG: chaperone NapD [Clostridia bacterium]|nr:chaperone NapD [Clostridia bacterium]
MVISSLVIKCRPGKEEELIQAAKGIKGLEAGAWLEGQVVFSLESDSLKEAHRCLEVELKELPGAIGVYPVYIHCGEEITS